MLCMLSVLCVCMHSQSRDTSETLSASEMLRGRHFCQNANERQGNRSPLISTSLAHTLNRCGPALRGPGRELRLRGGKKIEPNSFQKLERETNLKFIASVITGLTPGTLDKSVESLIRTPVADSSMFGNLGFSLVSTGDYVSALFATFVALFLEPTNPAWYNNAGVILFLASDESSNDRIDHLMRQALPCSAGMYNYAQFLGTLPHKHPHNTKCQSRQLLSAALHSDENLTKAVRSMSVNSTAPIVSACSSPKHAQPNKLPLDNNNRTASVSSAVTSFWINSSAWLLLPAALHRSDLNSDWLHMASRIPSSQHHSQANETFNKAKRIAQTLDLSYREAALLILAGMDPGLLLPPSLSSATGKQHRLSPHTTHRSAAAAAGKSWRGNLLRCDEEEFWSVRAAEPPALREQQRITISALLLQAEKQEIATFRDQTWVDDHNASAEQAQDTAGSEGGEGHGLREGVVGKRIVGTKRERTEEEGGGRDGGDAEEQGGERDVRVRDIKLLLLRLQGVWPYR